VLRQGAWAGRANVDPAGGKRRAQPAIHHGAQYFTVRNLDFVDQVRRWEAVGVAVRWQEAGDDAWVGTPGMNAPVRALAEHQVVHWGRRIESLRREEGGWVAVGSGDPGAFDAAIVAVPAEQAGPLLAPHRQDFADLAAGTPSQPSWTVMAAFSRRLSIDQDIVRDLGAIGWAARDNAKPSRGGIESWVIQASANWSAQHLEQPPGKLATVLLGLLASELASPCLHPSTLTLTVGALQRAGGVASRPRYGTRRCGLAPAGIGSPLRELRRPGFRGDAQQH
jgi:predicted NAD/FAD-dependent oxidoreductase